MKYKAFWVLLIIGAFGLAMMPGKVNAQTYTHLDVTFTLWFIDNAWDTGAKITLYDENWVLIDEEFTDVELEPDPGFNHLTYTFTDIPIEAVNFGIVWDIGGISEWLPDSPIFGEINWQNYEVAEESGEVE